MGVFFGIFLVATVAIWVALDRLFIRPVSTSGKFAVFAGSVAAGAVGTFLFYWLALGAAVSSGFGWVGKQQVVRYKLELTFVADGQEHVFSGVYELHAGTQSSIDTGSGLNIDLYGEAIPIEIPGHRKLYALKLARAIGGNGPLLIANACKINSDDFKQGGSYDRRAWIRTIAAFEGPCELASPAGPIFARFEEPADHFSIELVSPYQLRDHEAFEGISLTKVVVDNTREPVTFGLLDELPRLESDTIWARKVGSDVTSTYQYRNPTRDDGQAALHLSDRLFRQDFPR